MRDLGMGRNVTERRIQIEAKCLDEELRTLVGKPFQPNQILTRTVSNVICQFNLSLDSALPQKATSFRRSIKR